MSIYAYFLALEMSLVKSGVAQESVVSLQPNPTKNINFERSVDHELSQAYKLCEQNSMFIKAVDSCSLWGKIETTQPSSDYLNYFKINKVKKNLLLTNSQLNDITTKQDILPRLSSDDNPLVIPTQPQEVKTDLTPLTLEEAKQLALANNQQLKITKLELQRAKSALQAEQAAWFPSLGVQSNLNRSQSPSGEIQANTQRDLLEQQAANIPLLEAQLAQSNDPLEQIILQSQLQEAQAAQNQINSVKNFATTSIDGSVGLQYTIYSAQRQAAINIAREQVNFNKLEVERIEEELNLQVTDAYYNLQQSDLETAIAQKDVESRKKGVEIVRKLLDAALATRLDLLNAEVELDNAIQVLRNTKAEQQITRRNLAQILSLSPNVTPKAADKVALSDRWKLSLEETIILALNNRVELEQQLAQRRSGKAQRQGAWAAIIPQLGLFANYDFLQLYSDEPGDSALRGFGDGYSVGLNFSWTLWDGGAALARAKEADAVIKIAEQQYADSANSIRFEVEQAYFQLPATLENVETATQAVARAQAAVDAAEIRFRANLNTQTEVLDAQNRLVQAENNLVQATLGYNRALAALERAVGIRQ